MTEGLLGLAERDGTHEMPVGGPVWVGWREGALTRAKELESLSKWVYENNLRKGSEPIARAIGCHLEAAREAANAGRLRPTKRFRNGALIERAWSNLDAAEASILNVAPADYVVGQMPSLLRHVQNHLDSTDPRRQELERIAQVMDVKDPSHPLLTNGKKPPTPGDKTKAVTDERGAIVAAVRGASSTALREQLRLRSFRNVVVFTTLLMTVLAVGVALTGYFHKTWIPLCFAPDIPGKDEVMIVCPTTQSGPISPEIGSIDDHIKSTATPHDLLVVLLVGLTAAAVSTAAAIRRVQGSSDRFFLPVALASLKLPTGAMMAFLGLLLMRGQFVPGLTALDESAQILAWALVFGYAQQLFTRFVDQQGQSILDNVHGTGKSKAKKSPS